MKARPRSVRQAQALLAAQLRSQGRSWADIGTYFQATYHVNPRVALRQAHGWSQPQAAERWTALWPDDPKTFKNFSYWEQWPGQTGHAPSLDTLDRLARLYECKVTDLLTDCQDYGAMVAPAAMAWLQARDRAQEPALAQFQSRPHWRPAEQAMAWRTTTQPDVMSGSWTAVPPAALPAAAVPPAAVPPAAVPPAAVASPAVSSSVVSLSALHAALDLITRYQAGGADGQGSEADEPDGRLRRRTLLLEASSALAVMAAAPVLEVPRIVAGARSDRARSDLAIVSHTGDVVAGLRRLGSTVGPRITLPPALALRSAMTSLGRNLPDIVTSEALTTYGDLTQLIGWLMFNLGDYKAARYYYDDARAAAYRAGNDDLVSYTLSTASQLAVSMQRPQNAVDHAQAALHSAKASGSPYAVAYAADAAARAYAAAGQIGRCRAALDREQEALGLIDDDAPQSSWWYFYGRSFYWGTESECALKLNMPVDAWEAASRSLHLVCPTNVHSTALTLGLQAEALIRQGEIEYACQTLARSARLTTLNSSRRISRRIDHLRRQLRPSQDTRAVRELDEKLAEYARARAEGNGADDAAAHPDLG